jgi:hypothetical protein
MGNKNLLLTFMITACLFSCTDQLEIEPISSIVVENFYNNAADAEAAVNSIYSMLTNHHLYNQYNETMQSQGTDDAEWGKGRNTSNTGKNEMDKFLFTPASNILYEYWVASYKVVNTANTVIEKVSMMEIDQANKDQFVGEAKFLRGLIYFNLVRLYGDVPLSTKSTTSLDGLQIPRTPAPDIYDFIVNDFKDAKALLPMSYPGTDLGRATKGAAMTLLCKVYLTLEMYQEVATEAQEITNLGIYSLMDQYAEIFTAANENGPESIFEVQYMITPEGGLGSSYAGFMAPPSRGGYGDNPVTKNLYDTYNAGDLRRDVNIFMDLTAPSSVKEPFYVNKYDERGPVVGDNGDNYIITRYADVLLMHAEALSALNPTDEKAYELINQIRRRASGLPLSLDSEFDMEAGLTQEQFLDSVLVERRKEFAFEGHRRFDLLRTGKLIEAMAISNPELLVEEKHLLFPIPQTERLANPELTQNPGW